MGQANWLKWLKPLGILSRQAILAAAMLLTMGCVLPAVLRDPPQWTIAWIAFGVCWLGAAGALASSFFCRRRRNPMLHVALPMFFRTALPLATVLILHYWGHLKDGHGVVYIILFYFVALAVETPLSVFPPDRSASRPEQPE